MGVSFKGSISFGLIYIPINLQVATKDEKIGFNMLHDECKQKIRYKKVCEYCVEEVTNKDIVKGYEYEDGKYVVFDDDDFEKIKTEKDKSINIVQFVDLSEIDPIYYDKTYYVVPTGGERAFQLLKQALKETNKVGIAKAVIGSNESLVAIRISDDKMILNKMFFYNEIRSVQYPVFDQDINQAEVDLAKQLITNMSSKFKPEVYHDEYLDKLKSAIEQKIEGKEITIKEEKEDHNVINLMEALQASIKNTEGPNA